MERRSFSGTSAPRTAPDLRQLVHGQRHRLTLGPHGQHSGASAPRTAPEPALYTTERGASTMDSSTERLYTLAAPIKPELALPCCWLCGSGGGCGGGGSVHSPQHTLSRTLCPHYPVVFREQICLSH